jgi:orotate phosphoribosyltransferase
MSSIEDLHVLKAAIERHCIAVQAQPVQLASGGWSNYYCDLKGVTLHPRYAKIIGELMLPAVTEAGADAVGGLAAGCIPIADAVGRAALDAGQMLPTFFGRAEAKDHGPQEKASMRAALSEDGEPLSPQPGRRVAVVEDAVTQGSAAMRAVRPPSGGLRGRVGADGRRAARGRRRALPGDRHPVPAAVPHAGGREPAPGRAGAGAAGSAGCRLSAA